MTFLSWIVGGGVHRLHVRSSPRPVVRLLTAAEQVPRQRRGALPRNAPKASLPRSWLSISPLRITCAARMSNSEIALANSCLHGSDFRPLPPGTSGAPRAGLTGNCRVHRQGVLNGHHAAISGWFPGTWSSLRCGEPPTPGATAPCPVSGHALPRKCTEVETLTILPGSHPGKTASRPMERDVLDGHPLRRGCFHEKARGCSPRRPARLHAGKAVFLPDEKPGCEAGTDATAGRTTNMAFTLSMFLGACQARIFPRRFRSGIHHVLRIACNARHRAKIDSRQVSGGFSETDAGQISTFRGFRKVS